MCVARTARRRRAQAANGFRHMAPMKRPRYKRIGAEKSAKTLARIRALVARGIKV